MDIENLPEFLHWVRSRQDFGDSESMIDDDPKFMLGAQQAQILNENIKTLVGSHRPRSNFANTYSAIPKQATATKITSMYLMIHYLHSRFSKSGFGSPFKNSDRAMALRRYRSTSSGAIISPYPAQVGQASGWFGFGE
jgi:hypothetical protein